MRLEITGYLIVEPDTGKFIPLFNSDRPGSAGTHVELSYPKSDFPRIFPTNRSAESFLIQWKRGARTGNTFKGSEQRAKKTIKVVPSNISIQISAT